MKQDFQLEKATTFIKRNRRKNFIQFMSICLLPIILLFLTFSLQLIPNEKKQMENTFLNMLSLIQENVILLFNDSTKITNLIDASSNANTIRTVLEADKQGYIGTYVEFVTCKQIAMQMNAIANSRDYIESIYILIPNTFNAYLTNQMNVWHPDSSPDPNWIDECSTDQQYDIFKRVIPGNNNTTLTIIEKNQKGAIAAVNINSSYFNRIFKNLNLSDGTSLLLVKGNGQNLAYNISASENEKEIIDFIEKNSTILTNGVADNSLRKHTIFSSAIPSFDMYCVMVVPNYVLFNQVYKLLLITGIISAICILIALNLSFYYSSKTSKRINDIVYLLTNASNTLLLEKATSTSNDVYGYISTHLIKTFLQNDYTQIALNEKKMEARNLELSALQYQINPHFLSNTLQMIDFEILRFSKTPIRANTMIENLSKFLQYSLRNPQAKVLLWQEVIATKYYTNLMQERFQNNVSFIWDIDEESMDIHIPKLIIQPLIENALQHGNLNTGEKLEIVCKAMSTEKETTISLSDNGKGLNFEALEKLKASISNSFTFSEKHIGLQNIIRRLQLQYSSSFKYEINAQLNKGFCVSFTIQREAEWLQNV